MTRMTARPFRILLCLCATAAASPAHAQYAATVPNAGLPQSAVRSGVQRQVGAVISHYAGSAGSAAPNYGYQNRPNGQPSIAPQYGPGVISNGFSGGVPLTPGFGGNVTPQPGFGYQPGVILGPGFGGQSLQPLQNGPNNTQAQRYGSDGLPVLPTLYGNSPGGYYSNGQVASSYPPLLGGYYFSNYCSAPDGVNTYPTVYSLYTSLPGYFYADNTVGVTVLASAPVVNYDTGYELYEQPTYQVNNYNYTVNNYYTNPSGDGSQAQAPQTAPVAPAAPTGYNSALADIQQAWLMGNIDLLKKHLRDNDIKIAVSIKGKYSYSIASSDFATITKDAFDKLTTTSFEFTSIRKADNGDVTGYAKHVYLPSDSANGEKRTIYLAFTLSKHGDQWYITSIDSSTGQMDSQRNGSLGTQDQSLAAPSTSRNSSTSS